MPCLFAAIALLLPRVTILYLYFLTNWFDGVFASLIWPIAGFVFAPTTLLWYSVVDQVYQGQWGTLQIVVLVIAVLIDLSPSAGSKNRGKRD